MHLEKSQIIPFYGGVHSNLTPAPLIKLEVTGDLGELENLKKKLQEDKDFSEWMNLAKRVNFSVLKLYDDDSYLIIVVTPDFLKGGKDELGFYIQLLENGDFGTRIYYSCLVYSLPKEVQNEKRK